MREILSGIYLIVLSVIRCEAAPCGTRRRAADTVRRKARVRVGLTRARLLVKHRLARGGSSRHMAKTLGATMITESLTQCGWLTPDADPSTRHWDGDVRKLGPAHVPMQPGQ